VTKFFGWKTTSATRPFALAALKAVFFRKDRGFPSAILNEMLTFIRNSKGKAEAMDKKHDDCFVKNTMILTDKGNVPIQNIKVGDMVMTRNGYKPVEMTRSSVKKITKNIGLVGTHSHPIILANGEEKDLFKVSHNDTLHIWNQKKQKIQKLSYTKAKNIIENQNQNTDNTESIIGDTTNSMNPHLHCTDKYGLTQMEKYQKVTLFIIKMVIHSITILKTLKQCLLMNTQNFTWLKGKKKEKQIVKGAENNLATIQQEKQNGVHTNVTPETDMVYNLQIKDCHEYFANNILVHNCIMAGSIGYAILQEQGHYTEDSKADEGFSHMKAIFGEDNGSQLNH